MVWKKALQWVKWQRTPELDHEYVKILLQSTLFAPSVGGIETVSQCLAAHYVEMGHACTVITHTVSPQKDDFTFQVCRNPDAREKKQLIKSHDLLHCNGASLELVFWAFWYRKPVVWTHAGYQMISVDGLGWYEGEPSPLKPFASILFHTKKKGIVFGLTEAAKLVIRRVTARFIHHVAITKWVAKRQPLPQQIVIYNPFPIQRFASLYDKKGGESYDFFFLGRLVSEKGVRTLLNAFALFLSHHSFYEKNLLIIGDGNWRHFLEEEANRLGIRERVDFVGKQTGSDLLEWVAKGKWAIIPSEWEEPMGGVALEMLAAGKPVIVSQWGGLAECVGDAGLCFPNGNHEVLAQQMDRFYLETELSTNLRGKAKFQIEKFDERRLSKHYIELFQSLIK